jgi:hypothetical protein
VKSFVGALVLGAALAAPLSASGAVDPVMLPIRNFDNGFNTGNDALSMSAFLKSGTVILDEVPPHVWSGPNAIAAWIKDLTAHDTKNGVTDESVTMRAPQVETSNGASAYVVSPVMYHYKQHGKPMHEPATMTFALKKVGSAWFIAGWTWNGTVPKSGP